MHHFLLVLSFFRHNVSFNQCLNFCLYNHRFLCRSGKSLERRNEDEYSEYENDNHRNERNVNPEFSAAKICEPLRQEFKFLVWFYGSEFFYRENLAF